MYNSNFRIFLILIGVILLGSPSFGQSKKDTVQFNVGFDFTGRRITGTFSQLVVGGGLNVSVQLKNWHLENKTTYRYNKTNTLLIEDNWYTLGILKYYPKGNKKLFPGVFYHFDNNLIFRVKSRHHYGIGLGSILDKGAMKLSFMAAVANENATFKGSQFANSDLDISNRKNGLFLFKLNNGYSFANKKINLSYQLFYFQSFKESADFDIWLTPKISFKVYKSLSLYAVYDYRFENVHLEALSNYNDIVVFGLNWGIKN